MARQPKHHTDKGNTIGAEPVEKTAQPPLPHADASVGKRKSPSAAMPKATAVWLVSNTGLAFDQIAEFCGLHPLEVKGIADGDVAQGIKGMDPVTNGQLTRDANGFFNLAKRCAGVYPGGHGVFIPL